MLPVDTSNAAWAEELAQRLETQRLRLREALASHKERTRQSETTIQTQLASIHRLLQAAISDVNSRDESLLHEFVRLESQQKHVCQQDADLARHRQDLESLRQSLQSGHEAQLAQQRSLLEEIAGSLAKLHEREQLLDSREAGLADQLETLRARETTLRDRESDLQQRNEALELQQLELAEQQADAAEREVDLSRRQNEIESSLQRMRGQRSNVAQELRSRRKEILAEAEKMRADAEHTAVGEESVLALQLAQAKAELACLQATENAQLLKQQELEQRLEDTTRKLANAVQRVEEAEAQTQPKGSSADAEDLRKRLDMALADVRDLKRRNAELADKARASNASTIAVPASTSDDWEARKQRMLAQLESDFDEHDPADRSAKLSIEEAILRTEEVIAAKDQEIAELQRLLTEQSGNIGGVAIGAAAIAEMLDTDELIRQERDNLRDLQEKLQEQLKQAEIDISVERAKIARERALLEDKAHEFDQRRQNAPIVKDDPKSKAAGSRWLQRLGLRDEGK